MSVYSVVCIMPIILRGKIDYTTAIDYVRAGFYITCLAMPMMIIIGLLAFWYWLMGYPSNNSIRRY